MTTTFELNAFQFSELDKKLGYHEQLNQTFNTYLKEIDRVLYQHVLFNFIFFLICIAEIILFVFFFAFFMQSFMLAYALATIFFTCFAYFTLHIYFQTKKPEQLRDIEKQYVEDCRALLQLQKEITEEYSAVANACCKFANRLHIREYHYYPLPKWFPINLPWLETISCKLHWKDIHSFKEMLLEESVNEHIKLVRKQPTSLEAHASLANAYVMLSGLYIDPRKMEGYDEDRWIPSDKYEENFNHKFRLTAERAIEEFKILEEYAPDDPWVHSQLAYSYHDLQMPAEEIREYEIIQRLIPDDKDNLWTLGQLYFQQGMNAKGLQVYEDLVNANYERAETLITYYGLYK